MEIGSDAWDRLSGCARPAELRINFREDPGGRAACGRHTPGDLLLHIRAEREDLCFELAALIMAKSGSAIAVVDEVHGFGYFDARDLLGFVDGTENARRIRRRRSRRR